MSLLYACEQATTEEAVEGVCPCDVDALGVGVTMSDLIDAATDALVIISGGAVTGRCERTVRPCRTSVCGCHMAGCSTCEIDGIPLDGYNPTVSEVKIDGDVVATSEYVMVDGRVLARIEGSWPSSKNPLLPDTEDNTFSVTYEAGVPFDFNAQMAANELVCEMVALLTNAPTLLPKGTVSATKDGVQIVIGRLPGQEEISAVGLTWLGRFMAMYDKSVSTVVKSPEVEGDWSLYRVVFA